MDHKIEVVILLLIVIFVFVLGLKYGEESHENQDVLSGVAQYSWNEYGQPKFEYKRECK